MSAKLGLSLWGEEQRLRVSEKRVLRRIYEPKRSFSGVKRPEREADQSPPSSAEIKE
jgi:hypothetical protein